MKNIQNDNNYDRSEAENFLKDEKDEKAYDKALDTLFANNKKYDNKNDFIKDAEDLIGSENDGDDELSKEELKKLKAYKKSDKKSDKSRDSHNDKPKDKNEGNAKSISALDNKGTLDNEDTPNTHEPMDMTSPKDLYENISKTSLNANGKGIVGLTSSNENSDTLNYPTGINPGDNAVLTLSYSTDHTNIDIEKLKDEGWDIQFKKGASNGKTVFNDNDGDLVTLVATKEMDGSENGTYTIPTKDGKNDVSAQMTVIRGGNIDMGKMTSNAKDDDSENTQLASKKSQADYYLYVASADDPANYQESNLSFDAEYFGGTSHGDDAGATFISKSGDGGNIGFNYSDGGGRNDHSLSIPIVFDQ